MNFETTIPLYVLLTGLLTFIVAIFNKENHNYEKNEKKYFESFLLPYFNSYIKNKNTNVEIFCDKHYWDNEMQYIPGYVHYLRSKKEYEKLDKVLLVDYLNNYPSYKNSMGKSMNKIFNITDIILYFSYSILFTGMIFFLFFFLPSIIFDIMGTITKKSSFIITIQGISIPLYIFYLFFFLVLFFLSVLAIKFLQKDTAKKDIYTYNENIIKKIIKLREKQYDKLKKNNIFIDETT